MLADAMTLFLAAQAVGLLGWYIYSASSFARCRKDMFSKEASGAVIIGIQNGMLGSLVGVLVNLIYALMAICARFHPELKLSHKAFAVCLVLFALSFYISWAGTYTDYFAVVATALGLFARSFTSDLKLRGYSVLSSLCWFGYNLSIMSFAGILFSLFYMIGHAKHFYAGVMMTNQHI